MRITRQTLLSVVLALAIACSGTACGSSSSGSGSPTPDSVVSSIKAGKVLRVGIAPAPPYANLNSTSGKWEGVAVDFSEEWAKSLGVGTEYVGTTYSVIVAGLQAGRYDLVPALNDTPERESSVAFSKPLVTAISAVAVLPDRDGITTWEKLDTTANTICDVAGSSDDTTLTNAKPKTKILRLADGSACRLALQSGRAQAFFDEWHSQGPYAAESKGVKVLFPPTVLGQQGVSTALPKSATTADVAALNEALEKFRSSGGLAASLKKWGGVDPVKYAVGPVPAYVTALEKIEFGG